MKVLNFTVDINPKEFGDGYDGDTMTYDVPFLYLNDRLIWSGGPYDTVDSWRYGIDSAYEDAINIVAEMIFLELSH